MNYGDPAPRSLGAGRPVKGDAKVVGSVAEALEPLIQSLEFDLVEAWSGDVQAAAEDLFTPEGEDL